MHMRAVKHAIRGGLCTHHAAWVNHTENRCRRPTDALSPHSPPRVCPVFLLSFCRLVLGFVFWSFFALFASLLYVCIIDISVDQLCGSLRESEKCAHAAKRHSGSTLWPESGSAKPALGCLMGAPTPPPPPVSSKAIRPVGGCALPNFERPSSAPY